MSRRAIRTSFALCCLMALVFPGDADARRKRVIDLPNGNHFSCRTCHTVAQPVIGNGPRNALGDDLEFNLGIAGENVLVNWQDLWDRDSDGDGQTNGEELGDPCGSWVRGTFANFETGLSNPGEVADTNCFVCGDGGCNDQHQPSDGGTLPPDGGTTDGYFWPPSDAGTCTTPDCEPKESCCTGGSSASTAAFLALGLSLLGRRRRLVL